MIVLDASVMIAILDSDDAHFTIARRIFEEHLGERFAAHRLTLSESLVQAVRMGRGGAVSAALAALGIEAIDDLDNPLDLAEVRVRTGLKLPDACVLLAALRAGATLATFDDKLRNAASDAGARVLVP